MSQLASRYRSTTINDTSGAAARLKRAFLLFAKYTGLFTLARTLTARKTRVLAYHGIWLGDGHFGNFLYMSAEKFADRMALLAKWGYPVVALTGPREGSRCPTVITIDDGWYGTWSVMLPVLERHGYPATVYLATYYCLNQAPVIDVALSYCFDAVEGERFQALHLPEYHFGPARIDSDSARQEALATAQKISASLEDDPARQRFLKAVCDGLGIDHGRFMDGRWFHLMNPAEVKNGARRGLRFELHTHHHRITYHGEDSLAEEIGENRQCIHSLTGTTPEHFCYPSGRYSSDLWPILEASHITSATTTDPGLVDGRTPKYAMPRILDGEDVSDLEFEAEMCGFMELSRILRRAVRGTE